MPASRPRPPPPRLQPAPRPRPPPPCLQPAPRPRPPPPCHPLRRRPTRSRSSRRPPPLPESPSIGRTCRSSAWKVRISGHVRRSGSRCRTEALVRSPRSLRPRLRQRPPSAGGAAADAASPAASKRTRRPEPRRCRTRVSRNLLLLKNALQKLLVRLRLPELREQELHRVDGLHRGKGPAELVDLRQLVRVVELLLLAGAGGRDVDAREDAPLEEATVEDDFAVPGALELLEDDVVHPAAGVDEARGDDRERAAPLVIPRAAKEAAGLLHRTGINSTRENTAASALLVVVRAAHARDRIAEDDGVVADLDEALGPLEARFGNGDVVRRVAVARRGDHLARDRPLHFGDLLGTLVHEEHEDLHVRVVLRDGVRHRLQEKSLARLRGRDDQAALTPADRRHEIQDAAGDLVRRRFHSEPPVGVDRHALVELDVLAAIVRRLEALNRDHLLDDGALRASRDGLGLDEKAVLEVLGLDEELRKKRISALGEVRRRGDERA